MCAWLEGIKFQIYYHEDEELRREYLKPSKLEQKYVKLCRDDFLPDKTHCNSYFGEAPTKIQEDLDNISDTSLQSKECPSPKQVHDLSVIEEQSTKVSNEAPL